MSPLILSIDEGTTGVTASLVTLHDLCFVGKVNKEFPQIFPHPGWVEHDLNQIWTCTEQVVCEVLEKCHTSSRDIACIGITNQRETIAPFDRAGTPLSHAIVWQDRRTSKFCQQLKKNPTTIATVGEKTGLTIDPYFSSSKIKWLLDNNEKVKKAKKKGELLFGTMDTFLLYKLTGCTSYKTDGSNASRTMLYNIEKGTWDTELLELFSLDITPTSLPSVEDSFGELGKTKGLAFLPDGIPISGILGDQQAALFGQGGLEQGDLKCTYGTGGFLLLNTGDTRINSSRGLLTTVAYRLGGANRFALEGSCYVAGAAVQWLRDQLNLFENSPQIEEIAARANLHEMEQVMFLPYLTGIGSPHWLPEATGAILGLTRGCNKSHIARACLDGVALSINELINACEENLGKKLSVLRVDGGMCLNNLFCQIQSNVSQLTIRRPHIVETTAYGAALAAAIGVGERTLQDIGHHLKIDREFTPDATEEEFYTKKRHQWADTMGRLYDIPQ